jgi:hypothetical protein
VRQIFNLTRSKHYYLNVHKIPQIANCLLTRLFFYLQSEEFQKTFDCELDFYISHSFASMHIWLLCQRLQHFKRNKAAHELIHDILKSYKEICKSEFENVDTIRRLSKFTSIEELFDDQRNMLNWHFYIYNPSVENNFFKIDALVWSYIYRERIDRYDDRVYKLSHYLIHHFEKLKQYTFEEIESCDIRWDVYSSIPYNYKDKIDRFNTQISSDEIFIEKYSDFQYKLYSYNYKTPYERNEEQLIKTFMRYDFYGARDENILLRSNRREDREFDILKDSGYIENVMNKVEAFEEQANNTVFINMYNKWLNKYMSRSIIKCEEEDLRRANKEYKVLKYIREGVRRFSDSLTDERKKKALYAYRFNLMNKKEAEKEYYIQYETKVFYPDANVITSRKRNKVMIEKIFKL